MSTREKLSRRALGIAGAAAGAAAVVATAEPASAKKCRKKAVQVPLTHVDCAAICIEQPVAGQRGWFGPFQLEIMDVGLVVWFDGKNVPSEQSTSILVPQDSGEAGWLVYQIAGPMKAPAEAGAAGSATAWFGSFLVKSGEINGIIKLQAELIAGDPPPAGVMIELDRPSVVVAPYLPDGK